MKVTQSRLTLWDSMDYTAPGILQARILGWVAFPFSRGSSQPRGQTQASCTAGGFFPSWATREARWFNQYVEIRWRCVHAVDLKKMHNVWVASKVLFGAKWGVQPGRQHLRELWETVPKRQVGEINTFRCRGSAYNQAHTFVERFCGSREASASHQKHWSPWRILLR